MDEQKRQRVRDRAENFCEYCRLPQSALWTRFHIDHVIASQHRDDDNESNLCLSCPQCNFHKGTNLSSVDPLSGNIVRLFDPRNDVWGDHFLMENFHVVGRTAKGRTTARLLQMNSPHRVELRTVLKLVL